VSLYELRSVSVNGKLERLQKQVLPILGTIPAFA